MLLSPKTQNTRKHLKCSQEKLSASQINSPWSWYLSKKEESGFKYETLYSKTKETYATIYHSNLQEAIRRLIFENGYFTVRGDGWPCVHFCHLVYTIQFWVASLKEEREKDQGNNQKVSKILNLKKKVLLFLNIQWNIWHALLACFLGFSWCV